MLLLAIRLVSYFSHTSGEEWRTGSDEDLSFPQRGSHEHISYLPMGSDQVFFASGRPSLGNQSKPRRCASPRRATPWSDKGNYSSIASRTPPPPLFSFFLLANKNNFISKPEDWYSVTLADLHEVGFPSGVTKPKLAELLEEIYPGYKWEQVYLLKGRYAQQKHMERTVASLFPVFIHFHLSYSNTLI